MKNLLSILILIFALNIANAQIGINTTDPDPNAVLHIFSLDKGILIPRITSDARNGYINPPNGVIVYDIDKEKFFVWNANATKGTPGPGPSGKWEYINPWTVNDTDHKMSLSTSVASEVVIDGDFKFKGKLKVNDIEGFTGVINADIPGSRVVIKKGVVIDIENSTTGTTGIISIDENVPDCTDIINGSVIYVSNNNYSNWTLEKDLSFGNPNTYNVSNTNGAEGITNIVFTRAIGNYGDTKFYLKEGTNILDTKIFSCNPSGSLTAQNNNEIACPDQGSDELVGTVTSTGGASVEIRKDLSYGNPDAIDVYIQGDIPLNEVPSGTTTIYFTTSACDEHSQEETKFDLIMDGNIVLASIIINVR